MLQLNFFKTTNWCQVPLHSPKKLLESENMIAEIFTKPLAYAFTKYRSSAVTFQLNALRQVGVLHNEPMAFHLKALMLWLYHIFGHTPCEDWAIFNAREFWSALILVCFRSVAQLYMRLHSTNAFSSVPWAWTRDVLCAKGVQSQSLRNLAAQFVADCYSR